MGKKQHILGWEVETQKITITMILILTYKRMTWHINYINQAPEGASDIQEIAQLLRSIKKLETIINIKNNFRSY